MSDYAENNGSMDEHANEGREPRTTEELLSFYLFDELGAEERAAVEQALQQDAGLAARLEQLKETLSLLHRSAFDTENGELADERREALRAAAADRIGSKPVAVDTAAVSGANPTQPAAGRILRFPALKAAAAVALVSAGVLLFGPGQNSVEMNQSDTAAALSEKEMIKLESFGYLDPSAEKSNNESRSKKQDAIEMRIDRSPAEEAENKVDLARLQTRGFRGGSADSGDASNGLDRAAYKAAVESLQAQSQLGYLGQDKGATILHVDGKAIEQLGYTQADLLEAINLPQQEATVGMVLHDEAKSAGGTYVGPGDSVPPGKKPPVASGAPSTPAAPAAPGSATTPASPPPPVKEKPSLESAADPNFSTDAAFDSEAWNNAVGVGGGIGGKYGDRGGRGAGDDAKAAKRGEASGNVAGDVAGTEKLGRVVDTRALEFQELKDLGYLDHDGKPVPTFGEELELVIPDSTLEEPTGYYFENAERFRRSGGEPRIIVCDGYGRTYHDTRVVDYLRPIESNESPRDMFFRYYGDNPFVANAQDNLSTFAIDVDTASYPLARKYLADNKLPPRAAIRSEEFLNYFDHNLTPPSEGDFAVHMQAAPTPFTEGSDNILLKVGVKGREISAVERKPLNLVFVIDKSGSMRENNRMELVKRSLELLVDQLREDDRVGIVSFDSSGHIVMESTKGAERWKLREALRQMEPGGSTNAAEGLYLGYEMLSRNYQEGATNRVVLASDGVANTGETDQQRILDRIADFTARQVDLTTIGVGMNNHNDVFLEQMANKGDGSCHYVDDFDEAKHVFIDRFSGTMQTIARDVKIQVEFNQANVLRWRQIGYENRSLQDHQFRDDRVDAGEVGAGHEIIALYEVQLKDPVDAGSEGSLATVRLRWKPDGAEPSPDTGVIAAVEQPFAIDLAQVQSDWQKTAPQFRLAAVTAQYAEFMRRSYHVRGDSYLVLQAAAQRLAGELAGDEKVRELSTLITETRRLVQFQPPSDELWQLIEQSRRLTLLHQELHHLEQRNQETEKLMAELQAQNAELEERIRQHLDGRN